MSDDTTLDGNDDPMTDIPVGELLRRTRLHYGQSLEDVAHNLNIRPRQLDAIENGDLDALPAPVYTIGFIRAYADYLKLDTQQVVNLFKAQSHVGTNTKRDLNFPMPKADNTIPKWWIIALGLCAAVLILFMWGVLHKDGSTPAVPVIIDEAVIMPPEIAQTEAPSEQTIKEENEEQPTPTAQPANIVIMVLEDSWVEVKDTDGKRIVARVLKKGESYNVESSPDLLMTLGNAGGVVLSINEKDIAPIGKSGEIVRDVPLDADTLLEKYAK